MTFFVTSRDLADACAEFHSKLPSIHEWGRDTDKPQSGIDAPRCERDEQPDTYHDDFYDCESAIDKIEPQGADGNLDHMESDGDSRYKLEADILKWLHMDKGDVHDGFDIGRQSLRGRVFGYLDRQAAITANETSHDNPYVGLVRGKQWERTEISDYYCGRCGWKVTDHDSYCSECGGALHETPNKPDSKFDARKTAETPETDAAKSDIRDFDDNREKIEADVRRFYEEHECDAFLSVDFLDVVYGWLDRQAAITEREWIDTECAKCGAMENERDRDFKELQAKVDELTAERDKLREKVRHQSRQLTDTQNALESRNEEIKPRWKRDIKKLQSRIDALTAERDEWRARAAEEAANAEGHRRNANNIAKECDARARALDMQLENIHNLEHERDELRRQVSELRELNDSLHARIESAREALS